MAAPTQPVEHLAGEAALHAELVRRGVRNRRLRAVLHMAPSRGLDGFGHVHAEVEHMRNDLEVGLHLRVGARRPAHERELLACGRFLEDHDRVHGVAHPLAGGEGVDVVGVQVPVGHSVVQQHAGVARDDAGAEGRLQALQHGNGVAPLVDDAEAGGVLPRRRDSGGGPRRLRALVAPRVARSDVQRCALGVDELHALGGVFLGQQPGHGHLHPLRVRHVRLAVGKGQPLGLHHDVDAFGSVAAQVAQIKALGEAQLLQQHMAAGIRRRLVDAMAAISSGDGVRPADVLVGQILHRYQALLLLAEPDNLLSDISLVEDALALAGDALERAGQVLLVEHLAGADRSAAAGVDRRRRGEHTQNRVLCDVPSQQVRHGEAVGRQVDGRREHVRQRQRAVALVHRRPPSKQRRHGRREDALHGDARGLVALQRGCVGGRAGGVDDLQGVVRLGVDHDEAVAADARHERLHDAHRRSDGQRGVDGIAASLQRRHPRLRRQRVPARHHPTPPHDDGPVRREELTVRSRRHDGPPEERGLLCGLYSTAEVGGRGLPTQTI